MTDTIYALSTPLGKSAVAVVRLSGSACLTVLKRLCPNGAFKPRFAHFKILVDPITGEHIDQVLALYFKAPQSFTGEDCAEIHLHGSRAIVRRCLQILAHQPELRLAEAGEFTRRAWLNEKMNMAEAEALRDLIDADTESQRQRALRIMSGALTERVETWRDQLIEAMAFLEGSIDFVDEDDISEATSQLALAPMQACFSSMQESLKGFAAAQKINTGIQVVFIGAPNAGKSSLLNAVSKRDVAIVTDTPGTTRDIIEVSVELNGMPFIIKDTAGLRNNSADEIELIGITRAKQALEEADIVVLFLNDLPDSDKQTLLEASSAKASKGRVIAIYNKLDLGNSADRSSERHIAISAKTGEGIDQLLSRISDMAAEFIDSENLIGSERQRIALQQACDELQKALSLMALQTEETELIAEHVRLSEHALQRLIGRIDIEDVLDRIFSTFCVGK